MEYKRLSTEQFEALHQEFATFLAANSIDKKEWDQLKNQDSSKAENSWMDLAIWFGMTYSVKIFLLNTSTLSIYFYLNV